jgi:tetratricopeptide (TPR) repeat protein
LLQGLGEEDALDWFQALMRLPPEPQVPLPQRDALRNLFAKVGFHPLSVGMLARALKVQRIAELGERLEALLATEKGNPLLASLNLSLERLDPQSVSYLPRLGVFKGGAFEDHLIAICELDERQWQPLRRGLERTGLIQTESVPGAVPPFLRFHPTLAPALWAKLTAEEQTSLTTRHQERYYSLSRFLYDQDSKAVAAVRAIARRELPNLLAAVYGALGAGMPWAIDFADNMNKFLRAFGLRRDNAAISKRAQDAAGERGSENWYLARSTLGEQLYSAGRFREAEAVFADIVDHLDKTPSSPRCVTLLRLGRCSAVQGRAARAEAIHRGALAEAGQLEPTTNVRSVISGLRNELGDVLRQSGRYRDARVEYQASLTVVRELGDDRNVAVVLGQLGGLALAEDKLDEAELRYRQALETFHTLGEPSMEATVWHQLGIVYQKANSLQEAEQAYRESARINADIGDLAGASGTWDQLGQLMMKSAGKLQDAEAWYNKALEARRTVGDRFGEQITLSNLANLLRDHPGRLGDAHAYGEQALAICRELDPAASEIWTTYEVLSLIADDERNFEAARGYRREARASYAAAAVGQETPRRRGDLVKRVVAAVVDPSKRPELEEALAGMAERGWTKLVEALRHTLDGERDAEELCEPLGGEDSMILQTVLRGIADPASLEEIPAAEPAVDDAQTTDLAQRLEKHLPMIAAVAAAVGQPELGSQLDPVLQRMEQDGWSNLVASLRRILHGERGPDALLGGLDEEDTLVIGTILAGLENPETLHALLGPSTQPDA